MDFDDEELPYVEPEKSNIKVFFFLPILIYSINLHSASKREVLPQVDIKLESRCPWNMRSSTARNRTSRRQANKINTYGHSLAVG